jgi:hypothetical protein
LLLSPRAQAALGDDASTIAQDRARLQASIRILR